MEPFRYTLYKAGWNQFPPTANPNEYVNTASKQEGARSAVVFLDAEERSVGDGDFMLLVEAITLLLPHRYG